jgi:hypothetical protein
MYGASTHVRNTHHADAIRANVNMVDEWAMDEMSQATHNVEHTMVATTIRAAIIVLAGIGNRNSSENTRSRNSHSTITSNGSESHGPQSADSANVAAQATVNIVTLMSTPAIRTSCQITPQRSAVHPTW